MFYLGVLSVLFLLHLYEEKDQMHASMKLGGERWMAQKQKLQMSTSKAHGELMVLDGLEHSK